MRRRHAPRERYVDRTRNLIRHAVEMKSGDQTHHGLGNAETDNDQVRILQRRRPAQAESSPRDLIEDSSIAQRIEIARMHTLGD